MRGQGGATRLELAVAATLTALLAGLLLERLSAYQAESERVAAKQLISSLRAALAVRSVQAVTRGGEGALIALAHQNPMSWLQKMPENYLGEYYSAQNLPLEAGNWYFDRTAQALVYRPSTRKSFSSGIQKVLIFKVKLVGVPDPLNASGRKEGITGLVLDQLLDESSATNNIAVTMPRQNFSEKN
jgi:hypothetical protein